MENRFRYLCLIQPKGSIFRLTAYKYQFFVKTVNLAVNQYLKEVFK
jgi:hypothetical protein